jgi:hypothetical protein
LADQHLVHKDAERPPVDRHPVALVADHFRGEVLGRAAEGVGDASAVAVWADLAALAGLAPRWGGWEAFGESEVDELEVSIGVEEDVFRFEIAVGDVDVVVEVRYYQRDFGGVELNGRKGKPSGATEVGEYFAAGGVFELNGIVLASSDEQFFSKALHCVGG